MENLINQDLIIETILDEKRKTLTLKWKGKSNNRTPDFFLLPYFENLVEELKEKELKLEMNFLSLEYMNSSTITPILTLIKRIKEENIKTIIVYDDKVKWQKLSFSTLGVFSTKDDLLKIVPSSFK